MRAALNTRDLSMGGFPFGRGARGGDTPLSVTLQPPKGLEDFKASAQVGLAALIGAMHQHEPVFRPTSEECCQILSALEQRDECDSCEVFHQLQRRLQVAEQVDIVSIDSGSSPQSANATYRQLSGAAAAVRRLQQSASRSRLLLA